MLQIRRIATLGFLFLAACNTIETPDGKVPAAHLVTARGFEGTYAGSFDGVRGQVRWSLNVDVPSLTFTGEQGKDLFGAGCTTAIGRMVSLSTSRNGAGEEVMDGVRLEFTAVGCHVEGRTLEVSFVAPEGQAAKIRMAAVRRRYSTYVPGVVDCYPNSNGHVVCHQQPGHFEERYIYATGSFKKSE